MLQRGVCEANTMASGAAALDTRVGMLQRVAIAKQLPKRAAKPLASPHSSVVERILGKNEVMGSIPIEGSGNKIELI